MGMTASQRKEVRDTLHLLKPRGVEHVAEDFSNLDDIVAEYDKLYKIGRELIVVEDRTLAEGLASQPNERQFFGLCTSLLKGIVKALEVRLAAARGKLYSEVLKTEPRDISDRAINQIIDGNDDIFDLNMELIKVREYYERFNDLVESYNQRGFALNNLTKAMDAAIQEMIVNE